MIWGTRLVLSARILLPNVWQLSQYSERRSGRNSRELFNGMPCRNTRGENRRCNAAWQDFHDSRDQIVIVGLGDFDASYVAGLGRLARYFDIGQITLAIDFWGHAFEPGFPH